MRSLLVLLLFACGEPLPPEHVVVVCDLSNSESCKADDVRRAASAFLAGRRAPSSRFRAIGTGCNAGDVVVLHEIEAPVIWGKGVRRAKAKWAEVERRRLDAIELPTALKCSGIAAGMWRGAEMLCEMGPGEKSLTLISDLREAASGLKEAARGRKGASGPDVNFELKIPTPEAWVEILKRENLLPDLHDVRVQVCGVHQRPSSKERPWSPALHHATVAAWTKAFIAMNAGTVPMRETCAYDAPPAGGVLAGVH